MLQPIKVMTTIIDTFHNSGPQTVNGGSTISVAFDTVTAGSNWNTFSDEYVCSYTGFYIFGFQLCCSGNTGTGTLLAKVIVNGVTKYSVESSFGTATSVVYVQSSGLSLTKNDVLYLTLTNNSTSPCTLQAGFPFSYNAQGEIKLLN